MRILRRHVDKRVRGNARAAVGEPLEQVGVAERAHSDRRALVVDLAVKRRDLELADVLGDRTHLAIAEKNRGVTVDHRDLGVVHLLDVGGEIVVDGVEHRCVFRRVAREKRQRHQRTDNAHASDGDRDEGERLERLRLALVALGALALPLLVIRGAHAEEQKRRQQDEHRDEEPGVDAMDVDRRMEPPIGSKNNDNEYDDRNDNRLLAPRFHVLDDVRHLDMRRLRPTRTARRSRIGSLDRVVRIGAAAERRAERIGVHAGLLKRLEQSVKSR